MRLPRYVDIEVAHTVSQVVVRRSTFVSIQYLRAVAAILVVYLHIFSTRPVEGQGYFDPIGGFGVDIFFIISGFIMWTSTSGQTGGVWKFLKRRAIRIYPMWWIALTVWIVSRMIVSAHMQGVETETSSLVSSFLLVPPYHSSVTGGDRPILPSGWTLQIELVFYQIFAIALISNRRAIRFGFVSLSIIGLVLSGFLLHPSSPVLSTYSSSLLLEFEFGIVIAMLSQAVMMDRPWTGVTFIAIAVMSLVSSYPVAQESPDRWLFLGFPASMIVLGGLFLEVRLSTRVNRSLLIIGDASYSLYLMHPMVVGAVVIIWERMHFPTGAQSGALIFVPVAMVASTLVAIATYQLIERPLLRRLMPRRKVAPGSSLVPSNDALVTSASPK